MSLTHVAGGRSQKRLKTQHSGVRVPRGVELGKAESPQRTRGSSVSFMCDKCHFVCFVNLPLPVPGDLKGKRSGPRCREVCGTCRGGMVLWNSDWKELALGPLVPLTFQSCFIMIHVHVHTCVCTRDCVIPLLTITIKLLSKEYPGDLRG